MMFKKALATLLLGATAYATSATNSTGISTTDAGIHANTPEVPEIRPAANSSQSGVDAILTAVSKKMQHPCHWEGCNEPAPLVHYIGEKRWYFCSGKHCPRPTMRMTRRRLTRAKRLAERMARQARL